MPKKRQHIGTRQISPDRHKWRTISSLKKSMKKVLLFVLLFYSSYCETYSFSLSSTWGMEDGENLTNIYILTNRIWKYIPILEKRRIGRIGKCLLVDIPISRWIATLQHEYFGHGARARELDVSASYDLYHPWAYWPFGNKRAYIHYKNGYPKGINERLLLTTGGIESNQVLAHNLAKRIYGKEIMDYYELLFFFINKVSLNCYIFRTPNPKSSPNGFRNELEEGGDIASYIVKMDIKRGNGGIIPSQSIIEGYLNLKRASFWNLLDPTIWIGIWQVVRYWLGEKDSFQMPMINYKSIRFIPLTRFNLTPLGSEAYLDLYIKREERLLDIYLRYGDGPDGRFYGGGIEMEEMLTKKDFAIGGKIDWWNQPIDEDGYHLMASLSKYVTKQIAFTVKAGLKSKGYLMGKKFEKDEYGAFRIDLVF